MDGGGGYTKHTHTHLGDVERFKGRLDLSVELSLVEQHHLILGAHIPQALQVGKQQIIIVSAEVVDGYDDNPCTPSWIAGSTPCTGF